MVIQTRNMPSARAPFRFLISRAFPCFILTAPNTRNVRQTQTSQMNLFDPGFLDIRASNQALGRPDASIRLAKDKPCRDAGVQLSQGALPVKLKRYQWTLSQGGRE